MRVILILASLLALALCGKQFTCNFVMTHPDMPGGSMDGTINYDYTNGIMRLLFPKQDNFQELYDYNANKGLTDFVEQFLYRSGPQCDCETSGLNSAMPVYFVDNTLLTAHSTVDGVTLYKPTSIRSSLQTISFSGEFPSVALMTDKRKFTFKNCASKTFSAGSSEFAVPSNCQCGKPLDVVLVLDRSSSINKAEFTQQKDFVRGLTKGFEYGPRAVNLAITNYNRITWDGPLRTFDEGSRGDNVNTAVESIQCCADSAGKDWCCCCGTATSSGILSGTDIFTKTPSGRVGAGKVMIVLTDGYHNRPQDGRDNNGRPIGTSTESKDDALLTQDLTKWVKNVYAKVPGIVTIAISVGVDRHSYDKQMLVIADGHKERVFGVDGFNQLSQVIKSVVATTCDETTKPCAACCGFCNCGTCKTPDQCTPTNFCEVAVKEGTCCKTVKKDDTECNKDNKCFTYVCDPAANGGKGGCVEIPKAIPENTKCVEYTCNPDNGEIISKVVCEKRCDEILQKGCNDNNECTKEECVRKDPKDEWSVTCEYTPIATECNTNNLCKKDWCDPVDFCKHEEINPCDDQNPCTSDECDPTGNNGKGACVFTPNPLPKSNECVRYTCDTKTGETIENLICDGGDCGCCTTDAGCDDKNACTTDVCKFRIEGDVTTGYCAYDSITCNDNNMCTDDMCLPDTGCEFPTKAEFPCDDENACTIDKCEPELNGGKGQCTHTDVPLPEGDQCHSYTCDGKTGEAVEHFDEGCLTCEKDKDCRVDACSIPKCIDGGQPNSRCELEDISETCEDENVCTDDSCDPEEGCVFTPKDEDFCDDNNACTEDICDPELGCLHTNITCEHVEDACHESVCDPMEGCLAVTFDCPTSDNCTVTGCNATDDNSGGCYAREEDCGVPVAAIGAISGGVIAGMVVAIAGGLLIAGGGGAYAFSHGAGAGAGTGTVQNPIYQSAGNSGDNALYQPS